MKTKLNQIFKVFFTLIVLFSFLIISANFNLVSAQNEEASAEQGNIETLKFKDANIQIVIRSIAQKAYRDGKKVNIVASSEVTGKVNIDLENVYWKEALEVILKSHNYDYEWLSNYMILISTAENITKRRERESISKEVEPIQTEVFVFNFAKVEDLKNIIKELVSNRGKVTTDKRTNTVIIADTQSNIESIRNDVKSLDAITPQVLIEAKVIETNLDVTNKLGVKWNVSATASGAKRPHIWPFKKSSNNEYLDNNWPPAWGSGSEAVTPSAPFSFGTLDASNLSATLDLILSDGDTKILSQPKLLTMDNTTANIEVITEDPVPDFTYNSDTGSWEISGYEYIKYGVFLKVTPQINKQGFITLFIEPKVSDSSRNKTFTSASGVEALIPVIDTRQVSTQIMIEDGKTLVIGGLIKDKDIDTITKVPLLGDIPILGWLFKHKDKTKEKVNLLIFITPKIMTPQINKTVSQLIEEKSKK